jgi:acetyl-CoA C-acetyltransferase
MTRAFIIAARRTAVMPAGGAFARLMPHDLAAPVMRACLCDAGLEAERVDEVVLANAYGAGGNPARLAALAADLPQSVAGLTIDRQCAGGLDAILVARALVVSGAAQVVLAGGAESASRRPVRLRTDPDGGPDVAYDAAPFTPWPDRDPNMHAAAAALARRLGIGRKAQDDWAVRSHALARVARLPEITALPQGDRDAFTRNLTIATAARARPIIGSITPANTAIAADAAAICLVVSEQIARQAARALHIAAGATLGGVVPEEPGLAPLGAIGRVLSTRPMLTQIEMMEAYAVQALACIDGAGLDRDIVNLGGGALARGHPIGASGAILATRLFADLTRGFGLAAIAAAGGIGTALLLEI